jgi:hypothetical protein
MIDTIALLRKTADECEGQARRASPGNTRSELMDIAAEWHWLAGRATMLHDRARQVDTAAVCSGSSLGTPYPIEWSSSSAS